MTNKLKEIMEEAVKIIDLINSHKGSNHPNNCESDNPEYERFAVKLKEKYKTKFLQFLSEAKDEIKNTD